MTTHSDQLWWTLEETPPRLRLITNNIRLKLARDGDAAAIL